MRTFALSLLVLVALAVGSLSIGCSLLEPAKSFKQVDSQGLLDAQGKGAQVVDVRSQGEFKLGHIAGAINVPVDAVQAASANWDRSATYVIYCQSASRSAAAVQTLQGLGFTKLLELSRGLDGWTGALVTDDQSSTGLIKTAGKPVMVEFFTDS